MQLEGGSGAPTDPYSLFKPREIFSLLNRATQVVFEGVPSFPDAGRMWRIVDKFAVT